jgi:hypothetical protein
MLTFALIIYVVLGNLIKKKASSLADQPGILVRFSKMGCVDIPWSQMIQVAATPMIIGSRPMITIWVATQVGCKANKRLMVLDIPRAEGEIWGIYFI